MADDRVGDLLADGVVRQQQAAAVRPGVEDVQDVLTVGRAHHPLELEVGDVGVEGPRHPGGQVVAAGEDEPLVVGQALAGLADAVEALDPLGARVEDQVAPRGLVVRQDAQQDQRAHAGVEHRRVGQALQRLVDGLAVDALADFGVVLDLEGQVAADRLHEQLVADGDVRVPTLHVALAGGLHPLEAVCGGEHVVAFPSVVEVGDLACGRDRPPQDPHVLGTGPGLEHGQQPLLDLAQLEQARVPVVAVELREALLEVLVGEQPGDGVLGRVGELEGVTAVLVPVQGEHVGHVRLALHADVDVVAEQDHVPVGVVPDGASDAHDVPGQAVVFGADAFGAEQGELGAAEHLESAVVEFLGPPGQFAGLFAEPGAEHLVGARVQRPRVLGV